MWVELGTSGIARMQRAPMSGGGAWEWFQYKFPPSETISVEYVCSYLLTDFSVTGYCSVAPVSVADQATVRYT